MSLESRIAVPLELLISARPNVPAGHSKASVMPSLGQNFPTGQSLQTVLEFCCEPAVEKRPKLQGLQRVAVTGGSVYDPALQILHTPLLVCVDPIMENLPMGHAIHTVAASEDPVNEPAPQILQTALLTCPLPDVLYRPPAQAVQTEGED